MIDNCCYGLAIAVGYTLGLLFGFILGVYAYMNYKNI